MDAPRLTYIWSMQDRRILVGIYKHRAPRIFRGSSVANRWGYNWCRWNCEHIPCNKPAQDATWESSEREITALETK